MKKVEREELRKRIERRMLRLYPYCDWGVWIDEFLTVAASEVNRERRRAKAPPKLVKCAKCGERPVPEWKMWRWRIACPGACPQDVASGADRKEAADMWNAINEKSKEQAR